MARIRTIKPAAFGSESLARVSVAARWMFAGLWTYVDDAGRGNANPGLIKAAIWPLDDVTGADIDAMLVELEREQMILRYRVAGRAYLAVVNWHHQKISHPTPSILPSPPESLPSPPEPVAMTPEPLRPDRDRDVEGIGKGIDFARGARTTPEQVAEPPTARTIIAEWIDHCTKRPPDRVIGQIAKTVGTMLADGIDPTDVSRGLDLWRRRGLDPSTLPSVVNQVMNAVAGRPRNQQETEDQFDRAARRIGVAT